MLRSFRWGHVRQLDRVSRELLAQAWAAGGGPGDAPFTIDLDSTSCETYGLAKEGARRHNYTGQRGYHPLLAIAAGTGDVLMARLRKGRANTARGAAHFLRETVGRVRHAGATGPLTVRADSGFYTHAIVAVCRKTKVRFSITVRQHQSLRQLIEAIPEEDWTPIPYWMDGAATWLRPPIRLSTPSPTPRRCASSSAGDRRQLVLPVATTIFAGRDGVIIRYGGTVDYRPTSQAIEAETYGRQDTGNGSGQGWDERAFSAQVAEWAIAVAGETGASVAHSAGSLRRGVGG